MKRILLAFSILLSATLQLVAQIAPPTNLSGEELKAWLRTNWYNGKRVDLSYDVARGKMYNYVDNYNSKVTCVYSGYQESKPYSESTTSTSMANINCEHTVPQSWFNEAVRMRSDIHHLFPTVIQWNSDRGSDPFAEIPDNQTAKWMRGTSSQSTIPTSNIDEYSEDTNTQFEPREDHKGNLARSVFYFYTMHAGQTFDSGKGVISAVADINTLYQWHIKDPVDDRERERNRRVEVAQGNRNPYIDYPELVAKAWGLAPVNCSPATQLSNLSVSQKTTTSLTLNWTNGSGDRRLIIVKEGSAVNFTPSGSYSGINSDFTAATDQGNGQRIVYYNSGSSVTITGLKANTTYYVQSFESCSTDNTYNTTSALTINATTPDYACSGTPAPASALASANITQNGFTLNWANGSGDGRIVVIHKDEAPAFAPVAGTVYNGASANYTSATTLTDGSKLIYNGAGNNVTVTGLQAGSLYFVKVYESCSNGNQYETAAAPVLAVTTTAASSTPVGDGNVLVMQDFNGTANDGWVVTSGFEKVSAVNTGFPDGQRIRTGSSIQVNAATAAHTLELSEVSIAGKKDVYFELYNSSVSVTNGNGFDAGDFLEVYVALNGAAFSTTPDIRITANATDNQIRYGMNGMANITTNAGTPVEKIFTEKLATSVILTAENAPSILRVTIPDGTTSVKAKVSIKANAANEFWNVDDVALYATAPSTTDCDEFALEGHAGEDKTLYAGQTATIGAAAETGYTYSWSPTAGLSVATIANPNVNLTTPGTYVYTVTATKNGCTSTDQVTIIVQAITPPTVNDVAICAGESGTLQVINPDPQMVYRWYDSNGTLLAVGASYSVQASTTVSFYVEAVNVYGIASTRTKATVTVSTGAAAAASINGAAKFCAGETITYSVDAQAGATNYTWSVPTSWTIVSGQGTPQLTVTAGNTAGNVSIKVANNCGESPAANLAVTIAEPIANNAISAAQTICAGWAPTTIIGSVPSGGTGSYTYQWESSTTSPTAGFMLAAGTNNQANYASGPLNATTFFRRKVVSGACGENYSAVVQISVLPRPAAPVAPGVTICSGQAATLQVTNPEPSFTYKWFTVETGGTPLQAGFTFVTSQFIVTRSYYVEAVNASGCAGLRTKVTVTVNAAPAKPTITQKGNQLTASIAGPTYEWKKDGVTIADATAATITIAEPGNYTVRVQSEAGCNSEVSDVFVATVEPTAIEDELAMGVVVAPNPTHDKFSISTREPLQQVNVIVTNALGSIVYRTSLPALQTEQEVNLSHLPSGLYFVQVQAKKLRVVRKVILTK